MESPVSGDQSAVQESNKQDSINQENQSAARVIAAPEIIKRDPVSVNLRTLLEAGAHYGHQCQRWNPKMTRYIYGERNNVHIINLDQTLQLWERARKYVLDIASQGGSVLFVGTKNQAREVVRQEAERCKAYSVTTRWLGGTLSNFETIKRSIDRMKKLEELLEKARAQDSEIKLNKKEQLGITRELEKLNANLGGIRNMRKHPDLIFVVDINKESIAVAEARKLRIPVIALVDTNTDPQVVDFPIPSNDDAFRVISLFCAAIADAVIEGHQSYEARRAREPKPENENGSRHKSKRKKKESIAVSDTGSADEESAGSDEAAEGVTV